MHTTNTLRQLLEDLAYNSLKDKLYSVLVMNSLAMCFLRSGAKLILFYIRLQANQSKGLGWSRCGTNVCKLLIIKQRSIWLFCVHFFLCTFQLLKALLGLCFHIKTINRTYLKLSTPLSIQICSILINTKDIFSTGKFH